MIRIVRPAAFVLLLSMSGCAHVGLEGWKESHPEASAALGEWVRTHPEAAHLFFEWDSQHPDRAHDFVWWALASRGPLEEFTLTHRGWRYFDRIMESHRPAAEAFIFWARRFPEAAQTLMNHPGGLAWAGDHLYREFWR